MKQKSNMAFKLQQGYITQKIGQDTTIFSGERSTLFTLNETGSYIFQGLKLGWDEQKILDGIVKTFKVAKKQAAQDIADFTKELVKRNILVPKDLS